jgi:L-lactate utilization protein LutB
MMNQYDAILGLSGSLGSPAEQAFMRATYGVRTMATPPFLGAHAGRCVLRCGVRLPRANCIIQLCQRHVCRSCHHSVL